MKSEIDFLRGEIGSIKSNHHLDSQKMKLLVANMEKELTKETEHRKEEVIKTENLKLEIEEEQSSIKQLKEKIEILYSKLKQEKKKSNEEYQKNQILSETLEEEKIKMDDCQRQLSKESSLKTENIQLIQKVKDLEADISLLGSQVRFVFCYKVLLATLVIF